MNKRVMLAAIVALAMLLAVTPVLAAGSGYQYQDLEQNQNETNNYEYNKGMAENQEQNLEQIQDQEQNAHQQPIPAGEQAQPAAAKKSVFTLVGEIEDLGDDAITVTVEDGNKYIRDEQLIGESLEVSVFEGTLYYAYDETGAKVAIDFGDLSEYTCVNIYGTVTNAAYTALRVTANALCCP